jgi:hypothetical protein
MRDYNITLTATRLFLARAALAERLTCLANDSGRR